MHVAEMTVQLVSVERQLWSGEASLVVAQTTEGEIGVMPRHEPMLGQLKEFGTVTINGVGGERISAVVQGGFLSVMGDTVSILAEDAQLASEIDVNRARRELINGNEHAQALAAAQLRATGHAA